MTLWEYCSDTVFLPSDENIPLALWKRDGDRDRDNFFQRGLYDSIKDLFLPWKRDE